MESLRTFIHLHQLSLRFHLERQTGGLSRVIERGANGIEYFLFFVLFNVVPTLLEIALVCGILWGFYNFWFALVTFVILMVIKYVFRMKLRLPDEVLEIGDVAVHGEEAYPTEELVRVGAGWKIKKSDARYFPGWST